MGDEQLPLAEQRADDALHARVYAIAQACPRSRDLRAWEKQVSQLGGSSDRKALRITHIHGMEVRKKKPKGLK